MKNFANKKIKDESSMVHKSHEAAILWTCKAQSYIIRLNFEVDWSTISIVTDIIARNSMKSLRLNSTLFLGDQIKNRPQISALSQTSSSLSIVFFPFCEHNIVLHNILDDHDHWFCVWLLQCWFLSKDGAMIHYEVMVT